MLSMFCILFELIFIRMFKTWQLKVRIRSHFYGQTRSARQNRYSLISHFKAKQLKEGEQ